ncbi:MAG: sulfatase-like hydrolase/transferase [Chloroflexota bacterium]
MYYPDTHSTQMVAERAIARMRQTPADTPVFTVLSVYNLHKPNMAMPQFANDARCNDLAPWNPPNYNEADVSDKPEYIRKLSLLPYTDGWPMVGYCREMLGIDWLVAQVTQELSDEGRLDNTLLVFTADNGMNWGAHRRGQDKVTPYSTPVPLYFSWPARWGPRVISELTSNIDLGPTFCELGGCTLGPYPTGQTAPDGVSLVPLLEGDVDSLGRDAVLEQTGAYAGLRTTVESGLGPWHYVEYKTGERELYDLRPDGDPWELNNLAGDSRHSELIESLSALLASLLAEGRMRRLDASIAKSVSGTYKGGAIYSTVPISDQTQRRSRVRRARTYDYFAKLLVPGASITVHATESGTSTMSARYFVDGVEVTAKVRSATGLVLAGLTPGQTKTVIVRVRVLKTRHSERCDP